jgi:hypothetical protein
MSESDLFVLSDKDKKPDDTLIFSIIGTKKQYWNEVMNHLKENYNESSGDWNYYNDGKQWLFKMTQKKKTVFWAGLLKESFRITFYFGDKAESVIDASDLPQSVKDGFKTGKRYGKIRAISLKVSDASDIDIIKKLVAIKVKLK